MFREKCLDIQTRVRILLINYLPFVTSFSWDI